MNIEQDPVKRSQRIRFMLDFAESHINKCTQWEQNFIESISDQFGNSGKLSDKQFEILDKIFDKL